MVNGVQFTLKQKCPEITGFEAFLILLIYLLNIFAFMNMLSS